MTFTEARPTTSRLDQLLTRWESLTETYLHQVAQSSETITLEERELRSQLLKLMAGWLQMIVTGMLAIQEGEMDEEDIRDSVKDVLVDNVASALQAQQENPQNRQIGLVLENATCRLNTFLDIFPEAK